MNATDQRARSWEIRKGEEGRRRGKSRGKHMEEDNVDYAAKTVRDLRHASGCVPRRTHAVPVTQIPPQFAN